MGFFLQLCVCLFRFTAVPDSSDCFPVYITTICCVTTLSQLSPVKTTSGNFCFNAFWLTVLPADRLMDPYAALVPRHTANELLNSRKQSICVLKVLTILKMHLFNLSCQWVLYIFICNQLVTTCFSLCFVCVEYRMVWENCLVCKDYHLAGTVGLYLAPCCNVDGCVWRQLPGNLSSRSSRFNGHWVTRPCCAHPLPLIWHSPGAVSVCTVYLFTVQGYWLFPSKYRMPHVHTQWAFSALFNTAVPFLSLCKCRCGFFLVNWTSSGNLQSVYLP